LLIILSNIKDHVFPLNRQQNAAKETNKQNSIA